MKNHPLSILIPTYNRRSLLEENLNSIFEQKLSKEVEIVVIDDGSEDNTWEYLCSLREKHSNLKIYRHNENLGVSAARNSALSFATSPYIMFLDSDDYLTDKALEKIFNKIEEKREVYIITPFVEKKGRIKKKKFPDPPPDPFLRLKYYIDGIYADGVYVCQRKIFDNFKFNIRLRVREDWVFNGKIFSLFRPELIKDPLVVKRDHPQRLRYLPHFYEECALLSVEELFQSLPNFFQMLYPYAKAKAYLELATKYIKIKNYKKAYLNLQKAKEIYPPIRKDYKFFKKWLKSFIFSKFS